MPKVISKDGVEIAFDKTGQGPPVILVDGAMCYRSFGPMPKLAPLLAPYFTVYHYDRRGRGDSGASKSYAVEREIEDIEALIREAGGSAFVLGLSSGAALALKAAAHGLNIKKLALYEPPYMVAPNGHRPPADHEAQLKTMIAADRRGDAVKFFMNKMVGAPAIFAFIMQLLPLWSKLKAVAHTLPHDAAIMGDFSLPTRVVKSVRVPSLVMGGGKSPENLRLAVEAVADALPGASRQTLAGQTHNVSMKVLAPVLREFFTI